MDLETSVEVRKNRYLDIAHGIGVGVYVVALSLGGAALCARLGYNLGEFMSPELNSPPGKVAEHGIEIATTAVAAALGLAACTYTAARTGDFLDAKWFDKK